MALCTFHFSPLFVNCYDFLEKKRNPWLTATTTVNIILSPTPRAQFTDNKEK